MFEPSLDAPVPPLAAGIPCDEPFFFKHHTMTEQRAPNPIRVNDTIMMMDWTDTVKANMLILVFN